jgi:hypothetical protein
MPLQPLPLGARVGEKLLPMITRYCWFSSSIHHQLCPADAGSLPQAATAGFLSLTLAFNHCAELKLLPAAQQNLQLDYEDEPLLVFLQLYWVAE